MKSVPNIDYKLLQPKAGEKPVGKYGNIKNFLKERDGADIDEGAIDKKLRTFFEDLITEVLKNPSAWDRTKNINFSELFNYLSGKEDEGAQEGQPAPQQPAQPEMKMGKRAEGDPLLDKIYRLAVDLDVAVMGKIDDIWTVITDNGHKNLEMTTETDMGAIADYVRMVKSGEIPEEERVI